MKFGDDDPALVVDGRSRAPQVLSAEDIKAFRVKDCNNGSTTMKGSDRMALAVVVVGVLIAKNAAEAH